MTESNELTSKTEPAVLLNTAVNIFVAPSEAFVEIQQRPSKAIPLLVIISSMGLALFWYFNILDYDWFVDDIIATMQEPSISGPGLFIESGNDANDAEAVREQMLSVSPNTFMLFSVLGGIASSLLVFVLQSSYLSLTTALSGERIKFTQWFSLVIWAGLPTLLSVMGMIVTIYLSPNGQLSTSDLDPLTLANLGMQSSNASVEQILSSLNLTMLWSLVLVIMAHRQWLGSSLLKATTIVTAPYILILGIWAYFAFT